ncbi:PQQ-binding-like beta-propeller repeat protein [Bradyrhizobium manausense]|uniref:outer membrane protein assembly factor BamB family protein n=1 Tax=Bradyrhizobium TaxID=374 RepID=UPI001BA6E07F|nr:MULTISPECIES: PQQ-binding-like beta-propeller repeat protein [Bradyrhizobium]MBR0827022.1 PQQ-binding-like beta-propeller repeat protein [Bradyrhizobium manausense]UVO32300.1 PQQ-binding-like beta-propeller repeat protein [Bradyrhizobium arachidis]
MKQNAVALALLIWSCWPALAQQDGAALYAAHCAQCHDTTDSQSRVPGRTALQAMSPELVLSTLTTGSMASIARTRSDEERKAIAAFVTGKAVDDASLARTADSSGRCTLPPAASPALLDGPRWNGWGVDVSNSRFQPADMARLAADEVPRLRLKWAFGFAGASLTFAQPTVVGGMLFVGGTDRKVHALDAKSGCTLWTFAPDAAVRASISFGQIAGLDEGTLFFGDLRANVYAVNARNGAVIWKVKVEEHHAARITGAPTLYEGRLYVPVSSLEEAAGSQATYECCTFRGSVVVLDAVTGKQVWQAYTIPEVPHPTTKNAIGTQLYGPSGAAIWSAPTIDPERKAVYVATSNSYSNPPSITSDAVLAFDLATGKLLWKQQATPKDAFIVACFLSDRTNCPDDNGPDHDFGQSPILVKLRDGKRVLAIAQKSGVVHAFDPDQDGKILWQTRVGKGGALGGSEWGSAADQDRIYVAISDVRFTRDGTRSLEPKEGGGLFALDLATGKVSMEVPPVACGDRDFCSPALSAAISVIPGVVFSGGVSGYMRAYATADAKLLWEFDTTRDYVTVNGVRAYGGAIDGPGPVIVDGMLYTNSGYGQWSGVPGNVLLAFEVVR